MGTREPAADHPSTSALSLRMALPASRARGCMLGLMVGDALGAAFEGFPADEIKEIAMRTWNSARVEGYIPAVHMATYVSAGEPGLYRAARPLEEAGFVATGPPRTEAVMKQCARVGMYTDDTNSALALAASIVENKCVDSGHAALNYAKFWLEGDAVRGYPPTAQKVMQAVLDGVKPCEAGLPPHFPFPGGSFANGAAMRIAPLAIAYRNADGKTLRKAVEESVLSSHRHPEAIDFATVQAAAVQYALSCGDVADFDADRLLNNVAEHCETAVMRGVVLATRDALRSARPLAAATSPSAHFLHDEEAVIMKDALKNIIASERRPGSGFDFQIASVHMAPCVLWCVCRHASDPRRAIQEAIALGGDTDTTATMVGAVVGALHGDGAWCAGWASGLENGSRGRDYALRLAEALAALDITGAPS